MKNVNYNGIETSKEYSMFVDLCGSFESRMPESFSKIQKALGRKKKSEKYTAREAEVAA